MSVAYTSMMFRGEGCRRAARLAAAAWLACTVAGCSFSIPSLGGPASEETTGSINPAPSRKSLSPELGQEDWRRARAALAVALDPQGNGHGVKWDNPDTKLRGEITPTSKPYVESDEVCRRFSAIIASAAGQMSVVEGSACKLSAEEWELRSATPVPKS